MAGPRKIRTKQLLPQITVPMHESAEAFRIRFEKEGVEDGRATGLIRGMEDIDAQLTRANDAREKILADQTLNEAARKAEFLKYVRKAHKVVFERIQDITKAVDKHTDEISATINSPIYSEAGGREAPEIRRHVAGLDDPTRFVKERIDAGDFESASAVLGSKFYLAGLTSEMHQNLLDYYRQKRFASEYKTKAALEKIGQTMLHKVVRLEKFEKSLSDPSTLEAIEAQQARIKFITGTKQS